MPGRAGQNLYAGMHSHNDGIIHMEPQSADEEGHHATVGKYFDFGGWKLSSTSYDFLGTKVKNGDKCGSGTGTLTWALAKWDGSNPPGKQKYTLKTGNPASYKLFQGDIVVIAFLPPGLGTWVGRSHCQGTVMSSCPAFLGRRAPFPLATSLTR